MVFVTKEQRVHAEMSAEMHNCQSTFSGIRSTFLGINLKKSAEFLAVRAR